MSKMRYLGLYAPYVDFTGELKGNGFTACKCPFHEDNNASAGVDLHTGVFNCLGCQKTLSAIGFVHEINGDISWEQASLIVESYQAENNLYEHDDKTFTDGIPGHNVKFKNLFTQSQVNPEHHKIYTEYAKSRGLAIDFLLSRQIGFLKAEMTHWKRDSIVFPYIYDGRIVGIRYRDSMGNKSGEPGSFMTLGNIDSLKEEDNCVVWCEGESDGLRLGYLLSQNEDFSHLPVIWSPGAAVRKQWERELRGIRRIVHIPHTDKAGDQQAKNLSAMFKERYRRVDIPWQRRQPGKDICDYLINGDKEKLFKLIRAASNVRKDLGILNWESVMTEMEKPRNWLIENFISRQQFVVIAGPPKNMKTWLLLNIIRCILEPGSYLCGLEHFTSSANENDIVLLYEEEGDIQEYGERINMTLGDLPGKQRLKTAHRSTPKLDTEDGFQQVCKDIEEHNVTVIVLDPLQRLHNSDENDASETAVLWDNLHRLRNTYKDITIILLHHFKKEVSIETGWDAMRGTSRTAGEVDFGIFIQKLPRNQGAGIKARFDGRTYKPVSNADGTDIFKFIFDHGILTYQKPGTKDAIMVDRHLALLNEMKERKTWDLTEAAKANGVTTRSIRNWQEKIADQVSVISINGKACLVYKNK